MAVFRKLPLYLVTPKLLISLISRVVACSARTVVHRHTHTHTQDNYSNPHCACVLSVNNVVQLFALIMNTYCIYVCYCNMHECVRDEHMYIILLASNHQFEGIT